ncbi:response regulator [Sphingomonas sp. GCM10030256]|uniref:response regulator n=1 Tax=Sphingomonas sp. GCM10030256 TaxID=3273427 RepID=UPI0036113F5E
MKKELNPEALVVEDEPLTRMVAADAISEVGVKVYEASDAHEARDLLEMHPKVGLLFTDIELASNTNGLMLARDVHDARPDVELIVTSGTNNLRDSDLPDHGTFLAKPYRAEQLQHIVKKKLASVHGK